jgi:hypothetical protein
MNARVLTLLASSAYRIVGRVMELRQRRFIWGALGIVSGLLLTLTPIESRVVKLDLPIVGR